MVANWLYGVAHRTALGAKTAQARRRAKEMEMPRRELAGENVWSKLRPLLDQELSHLPDKYRVPIVLCDLEGKSRKQSARQLGWPEGTLSGRLARGRTMLARRLAARGLTLSGSVLAAALADQTALAGVPAPLVISTVKAAALTAAGCATAAGWVPAKVTILVQGVLRAMFMTKIKVATAWLLAVGVVGSGVGFMTYPAQVAAQPGSKTPSRPLPMLPADPPNVERVPPSPLPRKPEPAANRFIETTDILNVQVEKPIKQLPRQFLGKHPVQPDGTISLGAEPVSVSGQTVDNVKVLLAHLIKYKLNLPIEDIKRNLRVTIVSPEDETKPRQIRMRVMVMRVEKIPGTVRPRAEYKVELSPEIITTLDNQEAMMSIGEDNGAAAGGGFLETGTRMTFRTSDLHDGRVRVETKFEHAHRERNDKRGSRVYLQAVKAVDDMEPGEPVRIDLNSEKEEVHRFVILCVTSVGAESFAPAADKDAGPRVGAIKIVGNDQIPSRLILQAIPFVSGEVLTEAAVRKAENNLARLELFEVNPDKNIRPTVQVQDADKDGEFKDVLITVRER
jgi:hypothetical protein